MMTYSTSATMIQPVVNEKAPARTISTPVIPSTM